MLPPPASIYLPSPAVTASPRASSHPPVALIPSRRGAAACLDFQVTALAFLAMDPRRVRCRPRGRLPALKGATGHREAARSD